MEMRAYYYCIIFNCFILFPSSFAKTFSLNEAIAAEARNQASEQLPSLSGFSNTQPAKTSSKYRKPFLIRPPTWPKILKKYSNRLRPINSVKQTKRELNDHDEINQNYMPLFKSLSIILDNILTSDSGEDIMPRNKFKRNPTSKYDANNVVCKCAYRSEKPESNPSNSDEETTIPTLVPNKVEAKTVTSASLTTPKTYSAPYNNISNLRRNKSIPILPTRNSSSFRRNNNGLDERRGASRFRNIERTVAGNNRNNKHYTRNRIFEPISENSEENTHCHSRNCSGGYNSREDTGTEGTFVRNTNGKGNENDKLVHALVSEPEGEVFEHKGENQFPNRGIKTESTILLPEYVTRPQGIEPETKTEIIPTIEKDYATIKQYITNAKRVFNRNSTNPKENKKYHRTNELTAHSHSEAPNNKVVMIFDGYSVARDVNGENKMSEKAIEIRT